jgi:hypothetical protein
MVTPSDTGVWVNKMDRLKLFKGAKSSPLSTGGPGFDYKVTSFHESDKKIYLIMDDLGSGVKVQFDANQKGLTIFEASLLYLLSKGKIPMDYAAYHKCPAGIEFFDSIERFWIMGHRVEIVPTEIREVV